MPARDPAGGRRRRGRPPRRRPAERQYQDEDEKTNSDAADNAVANASESEAEEPVRVVRRRGRPPKRSVTPSEELRADSKRRREETSDVRSNVADEIDEAGEKKVDANGNLLGGREYKVPTFTLPERGEQLFMFAMEPARLLNYRDSYLFFHKNPLLERVRLTEEERNWLVDQRLLIHWFRNRDVAVVTARSCFKCFGSRIVKNGRHIIDDYFETKAREEGPAPGTETYESEEGEYGSLARRALISRSSRSGGYDTSMPINSATWMHHAALAVRGFNAQLHERRAERSVFYDIHTNVHQLAASTQPTSCVFECKESTDDQLKIFDIQFDDSDTLQFRGFGRALLDGTYDTNALLNTLPESMRPVAKRIIEADIPKGKKNEPQYPLAVMDGQYQTDFPIHYTRFNQPEPKPAPPSSIAATAQSIIAQQHYFSQMYNMNGAPAIFPENDPNARAAPKPPARQPVPQQTKSNYTVQFNAQLSPAFANARAPAPDQPTCSFTTPKGQSCKRPVAAPGERCQVHAVPYIAVNVLPKPSPAQSNTAATSGSTQQLPAIDNNTCADCHYLSAPSELLAKDGKDACDAFKQIKCAKCSRKYHPICANIDTPRQLAAVESYPWACPECKICCVCKSAGDESTLMICDDCDRGWHTGCCSPKIENIPEGNWLCPLCADCHGCDEHGDKVEYKHAILPPTPEIKYPIYLATYCLKCHENFEHDRFCPVCLKTFSDQDENEEEDNDMVACDSCDRWIHTSCDETLTPEKYEALCEDEEAKYTCPLCSGSVKPIHQNAASIAALKGRSQPSGFCIGIIGGKVRTRGVLQYKSGKVGVPEIKGTGIAEMPSPKK